MAVTYSFYVQTFLKVDEDNNGLFVDVPGFAGDWFRVRCDENGVCPQATHCRCVSFKNKGQCLHTEIVQAYWNKIYRVNIQKAEEKAIEAAMDIADEQEEIYAMAEISDQIVAAPVVEAPVAPVIAAPKLVKRGNKLVKKVDYHSNRTSTFFEGLPSRQKKPAA